MFLISMTSPFHYTFNSASEHIIYSLRHVSLTFVTRATALGNALAPFAVDRVRKSRRHRPLVLSEPPQLLNYQVAT